MRKGPGAGAIYDHFSIEFEYADGTRLFTQNRQIPGCWNNVSENAHGSLGSVEMFNDRTLFNITGKNAWTYPKEDPIVDPYGEIIVRSRRHKEDFIFADVDPTLKDTNWNVGRSLYSLRELHKQLLEAAGRGAFGHEGVVVGLERLQTLGRDIHAVGGALGDILKSEAAQKTIGTVTEATTKAAIDSFVK